MKTLLTTLVGLAVLSAMTSIRAAEIKVLASNGVKEALNELAPAFERETKHQGGESPSASKSPARRHPRQRIDGRARRRSPGVFAARAAELHRLPCRRWRGLEGLVGGKGADRVPHTPAAGAVFRAKGQEAG